MFISTRCVYFCRYRHGNSTLVGGECAVLERNEAFHWWWKSYDCDSLTAGYICKISRGMFVCLWSVCMYGCLKMRWVVSYRKGVLIYTCLVQWTSHELHPGIRTHSFTVSSPEGGIFHSCGHSHSTNFHSTWYSILLGGQRRYGFKACSGFYTWQAQWESNPRPLDLGSNALTTRPRTLYEQCISSVMCDNGMGGSTLGYFYSGSLQIIFGIEYHFEISHNGAGCG